MYLSGHLRDRHRTTGSQDHDRVHGSRKQMVSPRKLDLRSLQESPNGEVLAVRMGVVRRGCPNIAKHSNDVSSAKTTESNRVKMIRLAKKSLALERI